VGEGRGGGGRGDYSLAVSFKIATTHSTWPFASVHVPDFDRDRRVL
jgi:hypothetical protein